MSCDLEELECNNGKRTTAKYLGGAGGATWGVPIGRTFFTLTFDSANSVKDLQGTLSIITVSMAFGGGASGGSICMGGHCSTSGASPQLGLDYSIDVFLGVGRVFDIKPECCGD